MPIIDAYRINITRKKKEQRKKRFQETESQMNRLNDTLGQHKPSRHC